MLDVVKFLMYFFEVFIFMILGWIFFVEILYIKEVEIDYLDVFFIMVMQIYLIELLGDIFVFLIGWYWIDFCFFFSFKGNF